MQLLEGTLRAYPWGSRTLIAELRGQETPSSRPEAEVWFGAHPAAPSTIDGQPLDQIIAENPIEMLGERVAAEFDGQLPFLLKILAAGAPLSLQAHPSLEQAQEGYARENEAGIAINASNRNYRDANHKPELIVALTDFTAMAGFRPLARTLKIFDALGCPEVDRYCSMLSVANEEESLRALFTTWITIPLGKRHELIDAILTAAHRYLESGVDKEIRFVLSHIIDLNDRYPGDVGVLGALLLNFYELKAGEGIYLDAGNLHAYISGMGVEIMANSDNVLRGGLTSKYVDVAELVRILNFNSLENAVVDSTSDGTVCQYPVPNKEFTMDRVLIEDSHTVAHDGPMIILCTGSDSVPATLDSGDQTMALKSGEAAWVPASDGAITITGSGVEVFIATV